jgi:hypothetical protein
MFDGGDSYEELWLSLVFDFKWRELSWGLFIDSQMWIGFYVGRVNEKWESKFRSKGHKIYSKC